MIETYNLDSILNAINELNLKPVKKIISITPSSIKNIISNESILPSTEKLILEAEAYSNKSKHKLLVSNFITEDVLILDKEYNEPNLETANLEEIKLNVINDLYSSLSKKVKKNTLKIIFDLRQKIYNLEKEIEIMIVNKTDREFPRNQNIDGVNVNKEHLINEDISDECEQIVNLKATNISEETIKTLKIQNLLIKNFERNEVKLRLKIVDLEQDISISINKDKN